MHGITISGSDPLDLLLKPVAQYLDACWWYIGDPGNVGHSPPLPWPADRHPTDAEMAQWLAASEAAGEELFRFVERDRPVALPGFFSRYGGALGTDWTSYWACDPIDEPAAALGAVAALRIDWFAAPPVLPPEICLYCRNIDSAYWDVFFRDDWMLHAVRWPLGARAREYQPHTRR